MEEEKGRRVLGLLAVECCGFDISGKRGGRDSRCRTRKMTDVLKMNFPCI